MSFPRLSGVALTAVVAVAVASPAALALPLYDANGFSSPRFTPNASLEGQDIVQGPWQITSNTNPAQANVRSTVGVGGGQGVEVITASGKTDTQWYVSKPVAPVSPFDNVQIDWAMNYTQTNVAGLTYGPFFGVEVYDASGAGSPKQVGGFGVDSTTGDLLVLIDEGAGPVYATLLNPITVTGGNYQNYRITADYTNDTYTVWYNGTALETDPFIDPTAAAFTDAPITTRFVSNANEMPLNAGTAYFDNYAITVVPEPATIGGIAMFALGLVRRRR